MATILVRTNSVDLANRWHDWLLASGHHPILTATLSAAHRYLARGRRLDRMPAVVVTTMPATEAGAAILHWGWLDNLRRSAAPAPILLLAHHPALLLSPRPSSVVLAHPALSEASFRMYILDLLNWPVQIPVVED